MVQRPERGGKRSCQVRNVLLHREQFQDKDIFNNLNDPIDTAVAEQEFNG